MFSKKKNKNKIKKEGHLDKLVAGLIIGAAVGSVIGVGVAPEEGKATRNRIKKGFSGLFSKIGFKKKKKMDVKENISFDKKIPHER